MEAARRWYKFGVLGGALALLALAFAMVPGAQAGGTYKSCGNKKLTIMIEDGEGGKTPYKVEVKSVSVKNLTCADGFEFVRLSYDGEKIGKSGYPLNYSCKNAEFKVPLGFIPTICTKGGKAIKYGAQGG